VYFFDECLDISGHQDSIACADEPKAEFNISIPSALLEPPPFGRHLPEALFAPNRFTV